MGSAISGAVCHLALPARLHSEVHGAFHEHRMTIQVHLDAVGGRINRGNWIAARGKCGTPTRRSFENRLAAESRVTIHIIWSQPA